MNKDTPQLASSPRRWSLRSIAILALAWFILQIGGLFTPGLLDDVDSIYIEIAREMLHRHDFVTPYIDGIRFFDKPPLLYWMAAGSMHLFGVHDWAPRLPLALSVLALLLAVYALGIRLFAEISPAAHPDRGGFYAALALATSIGPYLYTRFYIPDILLALWMTLGVHLFLIALDRIHSTHRNSSGAPSFKPFAKGGNVQSAPLLPCLAFAAVMALNVLTKGLIGLVFPIGFVLLYLAFTRQLRLLPRFHLLSGMAVFLALAAPWHILAALRTPAIALPAGLGLPATGGWAWFYLFNEHIARFLGKRIPHDYGLVPIPIFWLLCAIWIMPWAAFLPGAIIQHVRDLFRKINPGSADSTPGPSDMDLSPVLAAQGGHRGPQRGVLLAAVESKAPHLSRLSREQWDNDLAPPLRQREAALSLLLWAVVVIGFFTLSSRQEYYGLPALPALALMVAGLLARADACSSTARRSALTWSVWFLVPLTTIIATICGYFALTAPHPAPGTDIVALLAIAGGPEVYNLSLSHVSDLTGAAMGFFRGPLAATTLGMLGIGLGSFLLRRRGRTYAANLILAAFMTIILLAAHEGLARFYPILGSKGLALSINQVRQSAPEPNDLIILDGELTSGSTLLFYTEQQVHLINGRVNGLWYGSFWPDAPPLFETEASLRQLWASPRRIFLLTYQPADRTRDLATIAPVHTLATAGGKTVLTNR